MAYITKYIGDKIKPYSLLITIAWLGLLFITAGIIYYYLYFKNSVYNTLNKEDVFKDVANNENGVSSKRDQLKMYFFHVDWCPYCTNAKPIMDSFKDKYNNTVINNRLINIILKDLTDADNVANKNLIKKYNINSYPTIFIFDDKINKRVDFKARVTMENLTKFINSYQ